jgi:hypothetical protein
MISISIYFPASDITEFLFMAEEYSIVYIYHVFFIHSSVDEPLGWFDGFLIVNSAVINTGVWVSVLHTDLHSFGYMLRSGIGAYGHSNFSFVRNLHTGFHGVCTNLHSYQQWTRSPFLPHPHLHLLLLVFLMTAILTGVIWSLSVAFPLWPRVLNISSFIYWPFVVVFWELSVQFTCQFTNWIVCSFGV